jgi:putative transposase
MPNYRRMHQKGGIYFFTVNLLARQNNTLLTTHIEALRAAIKYTKTNHPFIIHAWVVLPEHMHCIWEPPENDDDFATRWRLIKSHFSKAISNTEYQSPVRKKRGERGIWQRRFWEHCIRDEIDYRQHMDYIHYNPVKHGYVVKPRDWPYSTFQHCVNDGLYDLDWGEGVQTIAVDEFD